VKKIKYIIAVLILLTVTIFTVSADNKTLTYYYEWTTVCGTHRSMNSTKPLSQTGYNAWQLIYNTLDCGHI
jgi:hypothetical protein